VPSPTGRKAGSLSTGWHWFLFLGKGDIHGKGLSMVDIADLAFLDIRYRYEVLGNVELVINLINKQPDLIARREDLREFLIDIVTCKSKPASRRALRSLETVRRYTYYKNRIDFYLGLGLPKFDLTKPVDAISLVANEAGIHKDTLRKELALKEKHKEFKKFYNRLGGEYITGLSIQIANNRLKPETVEDIQTMFDVYNRFSDEKKDYFYSLAHDEELVEWMVKRHLKEIGEKFSKKKWEQERDKLVSEYRDRAERI
jgi:hypothetical protein